MSDQGRCELLISIALPEALFDGPIAQPFDPCVSIDFLPRLAVDVLLAGQPVVMNDAQAVRVDILGGQRQHAPGRGAQELPGSSPPTRSVRRQTRGSARRIPASAAPPTASPSAECRSSAPSDRSRGTRRRRTPRRVPRACA